MDKQKQQGIFTMASLLKKQGVLKGAQQFLHHEPGMKPLKSKEAIVLRTTPITWAMPFDEVCFSKAWRSQMMMHLMPWDSLFSCENTYVAEARKTLHNQFLEYGETDWFFMLDSDVCAPPNYLIDLLKHHHDDPEKKVLAGWYRVKSEPFYPVVYHYRGAKLNKKDVDIEWWQHYELDEIKPGLQEVDGAGAGAWLIHRDVMHAIGPDPYDMHAGGEDMQLCRLITKAGYKMWIDGSLKLGHVGVGVA